ncbi:hypothetical protein GCM10011490_27450 [Pseudoclavibacter endophyticus]|uniref:Uncharacterized protein n=1 Tax=Pseudoclavibacter endophyticus TaxID=1778590 RepID=A0A6H9WAH4_9MICO|nr:hypothetical protein [Pseudoclavibacter endophyticus]KAB1646827.1 hypothetical protein F8O04_13925 [Pseudoclavibacter endophyticus]GGA75194.1 hypothetical protein GCM10011490_27450 [Pseudoclavibacter endophyticus]
MTRFDDAYPFDLDNQIERTTVRFPDRLGRDVTAELYRPKAIDESVPHRGLVVGAPDAIPGAPAPRRDAHRLARRGVVALLIVPDASLDATALNAGARYLRTLPYVDGGRVGTVGMLTPVAMA